MMRKHTFSIAVAALVCVLLLLAGVVLAQSGGEHDPSTLYTVEQGPALSAVEGTASGGGYHLTSLGWRVSGTAGGAGYRLLSPAAPTLRGNGCCCTWIPCVGRNF
jgi:hypothetical protein